FEAVVRNPQHSLENRRTALAHFSDGLVISSAEELLTLSQTLEDGPLLADALLRLAKFPQLASTPLLAAKLSSSEPQVRAAAIDPLAQLGGIVPAERLVSLLHGVNLLQDKDAGVRRSAAAAVGKLQIKESIEPVLKLTADGDPGVRRASFEAL